MFMIIITTITITTAMLMITIMRRAQPLGTITAAASPAWMLRA